MVVGHLSPRPFIVNHHHWSMLSPPTCYCYYYWSSTNIVATTITNFFLSILTIISNFICNQNLELDNEKQIKFSKNCFLLIFVPIENILHPKKIICISTNKSNWNYQVTIFKICELVIIWLRQYISGHLNMILVITK